MSYQLIANALGPDLSGRLLEFALRDQALFVQAGVGKPGEVDREVRTAYHLPDLGALKAELKERMAAWVPGLVAGLGLAPFEPTAYEIELVAHGDGCFYQRHVDVFMGSERTGGKGDRLLSIVYYFFREPKAFSGGALRIYPTLGLPGRAEEKIDITVENDMAVAFSSWVSHEVLPVSCPSRAFPDSRFSINCWVLRKPKTTSRQQTSPKRPEGQ